MKLVTKEEKSEWYENEFWSGKKPTILKSKRTLEQFLKENGKCDLIEKLHKSKSPLEIKEDLFIWAFEKIPTCKTCGKSVKFNVRSGKYNKYCSYKCSASNKSSQEKRKQTCLKKYGVDNCLKSTTIREKIKQTCIERYGTENPLQAKEIREKVKKTNIEKYGTENVFASKSIKEKIIQTNLERYGHAYPAQAEEIKEKIIQTNLERYETKSSFQNTAVQEKFKQNYLKNHGVDNPWKDPEVKEKIKQTNLERYGVENPFQSKEIQSKFKESYIKNHGTDNPWKDPEVKEKIKQTMLEKYGVDCSSKTPAYKQAMLEKHDEIELKKYETKRKNNSFKSSKIENEIFSLLQTKFPDTITQYKSEKYPWNCDFYIPSLDLFIEYQGTWTHGNEPYNHNNPNHIEILKSWKEKSTDFYNNAICNWTIRDIEKRTWAKEHSLNWLEFFNMEQFLQWFNV